MRKTLGAIAVSASLSLVMTGCTPSPTMDYDPDQPRNWVKAYTHPNSKFPVMLDTLSVKTVEGGVQYEQMGKTQEEKGVSTGIATYTLNCEDGAYTLDKLVLVAPNGKVKSSKFSPTSLPKSQLPEALASARQVCRQAGKAPGF